MGTKIPPLVLLVFWMATMWLVAWLLPGSFGFSADKYAFLTWCLFGLSGIIGVVSLIAFFKMRTTVDPLHPEKASKLVVTGIYRYSRNPMYLAILILLICWTIRLGQPINFVFPALFIWYMNRFQIIPEERALQSKFGSHYTAYCQKVRRWV